MLLDLSNEVLEHMVHFLQPRQIVQSRAICSRFRQLVDASVSCQYSIELFVAGMLDSVQDPSLSFKQRLTLLRANFPSKEASLKFEATSAFRLKCSETFSLGHAEHLLLRGCAPESSSQNPTHYGIMNLFSSDPLSTELRWTCPDLAVAVEDECFDVDVPAGILVIRKVSVVPSLQATWVV